MKIALGTAQFGMSYGINNMAGQVSQNAIQQILKYASLVGIHTIDTAIAYEKAETNLGRQKVCCMNFRLVTKTRPLESSLGSNNEIVKNFRNDFYKSLKKIGIKKVYGLLVHSPKDLLGPHGKELWSAMLKLKGDNLVNKIGCSLYSPEQFFSLSDKFNLDLIQFPYNIYDQRYINSGVLEAAKLANIEVHLRSIFLQGLLFLPTKKLSSHFGSIREHQQNLIDLSKETKLSNLSLALRFVLDTTFDETIIVGTETLSQWEEIRAVSDQKSYEDDYILSRLKTFSLNDELIINPSNWKGI